MWQCSCTVRPPRRRPWLGPMATARGCRWPSEEDVLRLCDALGWRGGTSAREVAEGRRHIARLGGSAQGSGGELPLTGSGKGADGMHGGSWAGSPVANAATRDWVVALGGAARNENARRRFGGHWKKTLYWNGETHIVRFQPIILISEMSLLFSGSQMQEPPSLHITVVFLGQRAWTLAGWREGMPCAASAAQWTFEQTLHHHRASSRQGYRP